MIDQNTIANLMAKSDDELLTQLAMNVDESMGAMPETAAVMVRKAREWLENHRAQVQNILCGHSAIHSFINHKEFPNDASIAMSIFGLLSSTYTPAIAALIAVLVARRVLIIYCA